MQDRSSSQKHQSYSYLWLWKTFDKPNQSLETSGTLLSGSIINKLKVEEEKKKTVILVNLGAVGLLNAKITWLNIKLVL